MIDILLGVEPACTEALFLACWIRKMDLTPSKSDSLSAQTSTRRAFKRQQNEKNPLNLVESTNSCSSDLSECEIRSSSRLALAHKDVFAAKQQE
jgi:hypothetical protein